MSSSNHNSNNVNQSHTLFDHFNHIQPQVLTQRNLESVFNRSSIDFEPLKMKTNNSKIKKTGLLRQSNIRFGNIELPMASNSMNLSLVENSSNLRKSYLQKTIECKTSNEKHFFRNRNSSLEKGDIKKYQVSSSVYLKNSSSVGKKYTDRSKPGGRVVSSRANSQRNTSNKSIKRAINVSSKRSQSNIKVEKRDLVQYKNLREKMENYKLKNFKNFKKAAVFSRNGYLTSKRAKQVDNGEGNNTCLSSDKLRFSAFMQNSSSKFIKPLKRYRKTNERGSYLRRSSDKKMASGEIFEGKMEIQPNPYMNGVYSEKKQIVRETGTSVPMKASRSFIQNNFITSGSPFKAKRDFLDIEDNTLRKSGASVKVINSSFNSRIGFSASKSNIYDSEDTRKNKDLEDKMEDMAKELLEQRQENQKLIEKCRKGEKELSDVKENLDRVNKEAKEREQSIAKIKEREKELEMELVNLAGKLEIEVENTKQKYQEEIKSFKNISKEENQELKIEIEELKQKLMSKDRIIEELNSNIKELAETFEKDRNDLIDMNLDLEDALKKAKLKNKENKDNREPQNNLNEAINEIEHLIKAQEEVEIEKNSIEEENESLKEKLKELKQVHITELKEFKEQICILTDICHKYQGRLDSFTEQDEQVTQLKKKYRKMEKSKNSEIFVLRKQNMELNKRLQDSIAQYNQKMIEVEAFQQDAHKSVKKSEEDRESIHNDLNQLEKHYNELKSNLDVQVTLRKEMEKRATEKEKEVFELKREMELIRLANQELREKLAESVKMSSCLKNSSFLLEDVRSLKADVRYFNFLIL